MGKSTNRKFRTFFSIKGLKKWVRANPEAFRVGWVSALISLFFTYGLPLYDELASMEKTYDIIGPYFKVHPAVIYNWGLAKQGVQKYAEATELFERAYRISPKNYSIGFNLADSYHKMGKKTRALATLNELIRTYPDNAAMKNAYANWSK